jgi:hypothetical protein
MEIISTLPDYHKSLWVTYGNTPGELLPTVFSLPEAPPLPNEKGRSFHLLCVPQIFQKRQLLTKLKKGKRNAII